MIVGLLYKKTHFSIFIVVSIQRLDLKNVTKTLPKWPLQEKFSFQGETGIIHHRLIRTVEEHQGGLKSIQNGILSKAPRKVLNILALTRILKRFKEETAVRPQAPAGRSNEPLQNNIETVKIYFEQNLKCYTAISKSACLELRRNLENFEENLKWKA